MKIWVVLDTQTNGAQMTADEYLATPASNQHCISTMINLENSHRFKTLATKEITFENQNHYWNGSGGVSPTIVKPFHIYKSFGAGLA